MTEENEYMALEEAAAYIGVKRATIYNYLNDLGIQTFSAGRDRRAYITRADAEQLKAYKQTPWKFKVKLRKKEKRVA